MKKFGEFLLSLLALPFLLPWQLSEKVFELVLQPLVFRRYQIVLERRARKSLALTLVALGVSLATYLVYKIYVFLQLFPSLPQAVIHSRVYFLMLLNDLIRLVQWALWPVNTFLVYMQGGPVPFHHLLLVFYCGFLPLLVVSNLAFRFLTTRRSLGRAVQMRNRAVRDVDLVHYAQQARPDEIFLGLDLLRGGAPFYAKRQWLKGHAQIIGSSGTGKTESIIQPLWFQEVRRNVATFVLDGKGSRRTLEKFYTIATSLAQGHEVLYFNPADPERSATCNPVLHGSAGEIRHKIVASLDWAGQPAATRERTAFYLDLIIRALKSNNRFVSLEQIYQYLTAKTHLHQQLRQIRDRQVYEGLFEAVENFARYQSETEMLASTLREICTADYAWLLDTDEPEIDITRIYRERRDVYFTLPMQGGFPAMRFLGLLILQDMMVNLARAALQPGEGAGGNEGLLIIDESAKFASPSFIELLRVCGTAGVSVCYTNQSFAEFNNPALNLHPAFVEELAAHTNAVFCFQLGSPESIRMIMDRMGLPPAEKSKPAAAGAPAGRSSETINPDYLRQLEIGRCVLFMRQPRLQAVLKTGYFKFDQLLQFSPREGGRETVTA